MNKKTGEAKSMGKILVGIEILPKALAAQLAAGDGRAEPNANPKVGPSRRDVARKDCLPEPLRKE